MLAYARKHAARQLYVHLKKKKRKTVALTTEIVI